MTISFQPGQTWHTGDGQPSVNLGVAGDFYYDVQSGVVYQKINATSWGVVQDINQPAVQLVVGPPGPQGPQGPAGPPGDSGSFQPLDATLTAFAALTIANNTLTIGTGTDAFSQTAFAANTFPARASTGNLVAKTITDTSLAFLAAMTGYGQGIAFTTGLAFDPTDFSAAEPALDDGIVFNDVSVGGGVGGKSTHAALGGLLNRGICQGRLTLTSGTPITTSDVTGAGTLYFTPYNGNCIALHDTTRWNIYNFTEVSLSLSLSSGTNYDIFLYDNAGTLTLSAVAWTNDTTRATDLILQDGVWVKTGFINHRYLGTIRASGANTTEDSAKKRFVWNAYNQVPRRLLAQCTDSSHDYTTATWRAWNNDTTSGVTRVEVVTGLAERPIRLRTQHNVFNSNIPWCFTGVGVDSTSANSSDLGGGFYQQSGSHYEQVPSIGYHYYQLLQISQASGTTTWYGQNTIASGFVAQSGLIGTILG